MQRPVALNDSAGPPSEINLTPMLDVVFILLIFFIIAASFLKESGLDVNRSNTSERPVDDDQTILVEIRADSGIWIDGRSIDPRAVRPNVERLHAQRPKGSVVIRADKASSNKALVQVMDAARQAGVFNIALAEDQG
jgi:biopolymer transport protein ExbD